MYVRSPPGANQGPTERKHAPISWHKWQGPGEPHAAAGSRAERATRESGPERRSQRDSADGGKHSSRDQGSSRRSPGKIRGDESSREWRHRILREAAAERGAAAESGARRSSREGSRGRSERQREPLSEKRHRSADTPRRGRPSKSQSRDAEGAANTGDRREEVVNPRIGPAGPVELEETEEEAQLRRCSPCPDNPLCSLCSQVVFP